MEHAQKNQRETKELRSLVERIKRGDCVLVLGPGVSVQDEDPDERRPLDELLCCDLLSELETDESVPLLPANLHSVAELYGRQLDRESLELAVQDFYEKIAQLTTDFHRELARLPFKLCVSASPDNLMFNAFIQAGKSPHKGYYNFKTGSAIPLIMPEPDAPLVYSLFGHHDDPRSMVITEGDLIEFIVKIVQRNPPIPDQVRNILADPSTSFLFLGFGFHRWYLRVLLQAMRIYGHRGKAMAFEDNQFFNHPEHEQTVDFFSGDRRIHFRPLRWRHFSKQLLEAYDAGSLPKTPGGETQQGRASANAPKVFICYAGEDFAAVKVLVAGLEMKGIRIWQDKQDLDGGDNWERVIKNVIGKRVDYMVVVQTPTMINSIDGVFNLEIAEAKKKQQKMGELEGKQFRFLIPVQLGTHINLSTLEDLHVFDVSKPAGVDTLATSILKDWERRAVLKSSRLGGV